MSILIAIALKSLLVAGLTLGLLALMKHRSAAERSWVAHIGLLALIIMALAPLVLPSWSIQAPALFSQPSAIEAPAVAPHLRIATHLGAQTGAIATQPAQPRISAVAAAYAFYAVPAVILLLMTALALGRLVALQARAEVLVDGHWLTALARAQRRMGFKHGTALLTSNALKSPISWGLMRPVILLNSRAVEASDEAEAIIAHELAHVARMDWAKLLLARIATALFWFNPFVWLLAREAHQLREEAADDAVLAADIPDTDYAQLLVGVARHECPGLLLGAHGVAPSRSSLARRVARVLDGRSVRGPVAGGFAYGVFVGAVLVAAPLAALTLTPAGASQSKSGKSTISASEPSSAYYSPPNQEPTDLPHIIAKGVSTSVSTAVAAVAPSVAVTDNGNDFRIEAPNGAKVSGSHGTTIVASATGATVTVYPPDASGRSKVVAVAPNGASAVSYASAAEAAAMAGANAARSGQESAIDRAVALKVVGVTPEYAASMRLALEGYRGISAGDIVGAYAAGVRPDYIRAMAAAGYPRIPLEELTQLRAIGVTPGDVERFHRAGITHLDVEELIQAKTMGLTPEEIRASRDDP
jgi:beta-lactamase regulating signal transducer with metallopeptidase domain